MSRTRPSDLQPVVSQGVRYEQDLSKPGFLFAYRENSSDKIWEMEIYQYPLIPGLETDVQAVYFKSMQLTENGKVLLIENEKGERFMVDLKERKLCD